MDLDKIITTLCTIICTVVAVLTYADSRKKQLAQKLGGEKLPLVSKSIIADEKEKAKHFISDSSFDSTDNFVEDNRRGLGGLGNSRSDHF